MVKKTPQPLRITDVTLRDGHQSLLATRLRTTDMEPIAAEIDKVGFYSAEVWGGATFDVCTRFLNEDPWDRVRLLKKLMPLTPLQMLLRGQNLVGYRNYADDVVEAFIKHSAGVGIDIFRVFDALNDERNLEKSFAVIKACGKHVQGALCYSLTQPRLGGPVFNIDYYVNKALALQTMGADSLCIKDMAGLIAPDDAHELVKALKKALHIPVILHTHYTSGMASMSCLKAAEAGVDAIDAAVAPFALRSSHPAIEPMVAALAGTARDTGLDLSRLFKIGNYFESIAPKYCDFLDQTRMAVVDTGVLEHQLPGGMITNLVSQLKEAGALARLPEVYVEIPRVRKEMGYPPLVTPTSQIVGIQAVQNVLFGRYKMVSREVKDYFCGYYGRSPAPVDPEVQKLVLSGYERGEQPIICRVADVLAPEMGKAQESTKGVARDIGDTLIYALYPTTGMRFLRWKYGLEAPPPETRPKTMDDVRRENELIARAKGGKLVEKEEKKAPARGAGARTFNVYVDGEYFKVEVEDASGTHMSPPAAPAAPARTPAARVSPPLPPPPRVEPVKEIPTTSAEPPAPVPLAAGEVAIHAPMPGIIVRYDKKEGDEIKAGETIVVFEAMKMENALPSPVSGKVKKTLLKKGDKVSKDSLLAVIEVR
ncbi:MAG: pyruvate carboxyl transferase subunit [Dehalococcoidia bacterium]|nr:pyruvate carboxyl transferase subunit [Dehalococcoidia bacterium]